MSLIGLMVSALTGPLTSSIVDLVKNYQNKKVDEKQIQAMVAQKVLEAAASVSDKQASVIMKELEGRDLISRIWRPLVALSCVGVLLCYGILFPVMVAWFDFPPVKVGDQLLSWIFTLASGGMAGYIGSVTIENVARTWSRK